jgi:hypothetical protein
MTDPSLPWARSPASLAGQAPSASLADLLDRILDKGIVVVGDIKINLLDIELLTIQIRLLVASVDRAREMGIDWWEHDPSLSSRARRAVPADGHVLEGDRLLEENRRLRAQVAELQPAPEHARKQTREEAPQ